MKKLSITFLLGQILVILLSWQQLPPELPLFYSRPWGKDQLATPLSLFILPSLSLTIFLINLVFASLVAKEEQLLLKILEAATAIFSLLSLVTIIKIVLLVT